jgi:hypothetical protein
MYRRLRLVALTCTWMLFLTIYASSQSSIGHVLAEDELHGLVGGQTLNNLTCPAPTKNWPCANVNDSCGSRSGQGKMICEAGVCWDCSGNGNTDSVSTCAMPAGSCTSGGAKDYPCGNTYSSTNCVYNPAMNPKCSCPTGNLGNGNGKCLLSNCTSGP